MRVEANGLNKSERACNGVWMVGSCFDREADPAPTDDAGLATSAQLFLLVRFLYDFSQYLGEVSLAF